VIVAPPSVAVADEMAGVAGIAIFHCAITVVLAPAMVETYPAARIFEPSLQPSKVYPDLPNPVASLNEIEAP